MNEVIDMSKYWKQTMSYSQLSIDELKNKASRNSQAAKKGKVWNPIQIEGRQIAKSCWGQVWCYNIEQYAEQNKVEMMLDHAHLNDGSLKSVFGI